MKILVFGLRRSGNHFFAQWLLQNLAGCSIDEFEVMDNETRSDNGVRHDSGLLHSGRDIRYYNNCYLQFELIDRLPSRGVEIFSFEDVDLSTVGLLSNVDACVLIVRSPLNIAASHYRRNRSVPAHYPRLMAMYQRQFLNETSFLPHCLGVVYDRLHCKPEYATELASVFGVEEPRPLLEIPAFGGGSSFTGRDFNQLKGLNSRYQQIDVSEVFLDFAERLGADSDLCRTTQKIFDCDLAEQVRRLREPKPLLEGGIGC